MDEFRECCVRFSNAWLHCHSCLAADLQYSVSVCLSLLVNLIVNLSLTFSVCIWLSFYALSPMLLYLYILFCIIIPFSLPSSILLFWLALVKVFLCHQSSLLYFSLPPFWIFLLATTSSLPLSLSQPHTPTRTTCSSFCLPQGPVDKRQIYIIVHESPTLCFHHSPSVSCTLCPSPVLFIFLHHFSSFYIISMYFHHFQIWPEMFALWYKK